MSSTLDLYRKKYGAFDLINQDGSLRHFLCVTQSGIWSTTVGFEPLHDRVVAAGTQEAVDAAARLLCR